LYKLLVGKIGISPDYFLNEISVDEINLIIEGYNDEYKESWERVRASSFSFFKLPWDNKNPSKKKPTEERFKQLKKLT